MFPPNPDRADSVHPRLCRLVFDGKPLADHELQTEKKAVQRVNEMLGLGYALVGANIDDEIVELQSIPERHGVATADFEATLTNGDTVRIEVCGLTDELERSYSSDCLQIALRANRMLGATPGSLDLLGPTSPFLVRFDAAIPTGRDIGPASEELVRLILTDGPTFRRSWSMLRVNSEYITLHRLGAIWTRKPTQHRVAVQVTVNPRFLQSSRPRHAFERIFAQKIEKYDDYSDGGTVPVWLAMYVNTTFKIPYGDIEAIMQREIDPAPFQRLILGSLTIGAAFPRKRSGRRRPSA